MNKNLERYLVEGMYGWSRPYFSPHIFVNGECSYCGYSDDISRDHTLTGWSFTSSSSHSRSCSDPGCGFVETKEHGVYYRAPYTSDPAGHTFICILCGTFPGIVPHDFTPWSDDEAPGGWRNRWCTCGYDEYCVPEEDLWYAWGNANYAHSFSNGFCTRCGDPDGHVHSYPWWDDTVVIIDDQYHGEPCSTCDYINPWPHSFQYNRDDDDYHFLYCYCGYRENSEPHDWGLWVTAEDSTYRHKGCYVCGHYIECGTDDRPHSLESGICTVCG